MVLVYAPGMRVLKRRFSRLLILLGVVLCGLAAGLHGGVGVAEADEVVGNNPFMCWTSGTVDSLADPSGGLGVWIGAGAVGGLLSLYDILLGDDGERAAYGWGQGDYDFAIERGDYSSLPLEYGLGPAERVLGYGALGGDVVGKVPEKLTGVDHDGVVISLPKEMERPVGALFSSLAELVDYTFYMDVFVAEESRASVRRDVNDTRAQDLLAVLGAPGGAGWPNTQWTYALWGEGDTNRTGVPWKTADAYQERRAVARPAPARVQRFNAEWRDPDNPSGGLVVDYLGLEEDRQASDANLVSATTASMGDGRRVISGVQQLPSNESKSSSNFACRGTSCSGNSNTITIPVLVEGHSVSVDINDQERSFNAFDIADRLARVQKVGDGPGDAVYEEAAQDIKERGRSSTHDRRGTKRGFFELGMEDSDNNEIHVSLDLDKERRRSFEWNPKVPGGGKVRLLPFGEYPYTRHSYKDVGRSPSHDDPWRPPSDVADRIHDGYRQPEMSRAFYSAGDSDSFSREGPDHIRWPVQFYDLNWYLYKLPGTLHSGAWMTWVSDEGGRRLVYSGYGRNAMDLRDGEYENYLPYCRVDDVVITQENLICRGNREVVGEGEHAVEAERPWLPLIPGWGGSIEEIVRGRDTDVYLPFDAGVTEIERDGEGNERRRLVSSGPDELLLSSERLVKQGVESPLGGYSTTTDQSKFSFIISETEAMGSQEEREGMNFRLRYGIPESRAHAVEYQKAWKSEPIDPNMPYLMVVTFYEALDPRDNDYSGDMKRKFVVKPRGSDTVDERLDDHEVIMPERHLRRVVCRLLVLPYGYTPSAEESQNWFDRAFSFTEEIAKEVVGAAVTVLEGAARAVVKLPGWLVQQSGRMACVGLSKLDEVTALPSHAVIGSVAATRVGDDGGLVVIDAVASRVEGMKTCERVSTPVVPTCSLATDFISREGECVDLPQMKVDVRRASFIRLGEGMTDPDPQSVFVEYDEHYFLRQERWVGDDLGEPGEGENTHLEVITSGLEGAKPGSKFRLVTGRTKLLGLPELDEVLLTVNDPYRMGMTEVFLEWDYKWADVSPKMDRAIDGFAVYVHPDPKSAVPVPEGFAYRYLLPRVVVEEFVNDEGDQDSPVPTVNIVHNVRGFWVGAMGYDSTGYEANRSHSLLRFRSPNRVLPISRYGSEKKEIEKFEEMLQNMPLAPGFVHGFQVAPYVGDPEGDSFAEGVPSDILYVNGSEAACMERDPTTGEVPEALEAVFELYDCDGVSISRDVGEVDDAFRVGLLGLTGTDICYDIFSSTPAGLTWDNDAVRQVWGLVWILAGAVLFTLLVWQGLKMTYDMWLEPQPAVGFRQLVPRFFLAVILGAGSLFICQAVLTLASDVTCFVAQMTGMSMWGVVGTTMGTMVDGFMEWNRSILELVDRMDLGQLLVAGVKILAIAFVVLVIFIFLLLLFFKVIIAMLMRIALLAVLVALSPLAFAFFASDATAHWTKKWVSLFLGATFQQVVVLIVIYLGGGLLASYLASGADDGLSMMLTGMLLALMSLFVADRVPAIVNPGAQGMFQGFGQAFGMAAAAGVTVATMGAGAAYGLGRAGVGMGVAGIGAMRGSDDGGAATIPGGGGGGRGGGGGGSPSTPPVVGPQTPGSFGTGAGGGVGGQAPGPGGQTSALGRAWGAAQAGARGAGYVPGHVIGGMRSGARAGTGFNTRMRDHLTGSSLFRGGSRSDDSMRTLQNLTRQQARQGESAQGQSQEMINLLRQLNRRGP